MISSRLGHFLDKPLTPFVRRIPLTPNQVTLIGFAVTAVAGVVIPFHPRLGGFLIITGGLFDMLDGILARNTGQSSTFGAFLDSVLDRYSDGFLFIGTAAYCLRAEVGYSALVSLGCLVGAFATSYTRARAEGLGLEGHVGLIERGERIVLLVFGLLSGWLVPVLWALLVLTNVTALQRIYYVYKQSAGIHLKNSVTGKTPDA